MRNMLTSLQKKLVFVAIVVILFGVNKLPRLGRGLGEGIKNFKESLRGADEAKSAEAESEDEKPVSPEG